MIITNNGGFNWNDVAYEMLPISSYRDFYSNQPRIYMFEGGSIFDMLTLLATSALSIFWIFTLFTTHPSPTKALISVTFAQIFINIFIRLFKSFIILFIDYPQFSWLFITSSVETTFHYVLYLQYTSSVLIYIYVREKDVNSGWSNLYYIPSLIAAIIVSFLNVNVNSLLKGFPFYLYVGFYVGMSFSNIILLITVLASCSKFGAPQKTSVRCRLFLFQLIACPPILFNTIITIMDLLFMVVGVTEEFPIPYIYMTTYRYKAFEITPVCILTAFFALLLDLRKSPDMITTDVITEAIPSENPTTSIIPPDPVPSPVLPGSIPSQQLQYPPNPYGGIIIHIRQM